MKQNLQSIATMHCEQDWKLSAIVQFVLSPYDGAPYIDEGHPSYLETLTHHGLMWLSNCGGTTPDDEETDPVKLYTPTMAQDTIIKIPM